MGDAEGGLVGGLTADFADGADESLAATCVGAVVASTLSRAAIFIRAVGEIGG